MRTMRARPALLASVGIGLVATMGLGFALWNETLTVAATVSTGRLDMRLAGASANEVADNAPGDADCKGAGVALDGNSATVEFIDAFPGHSCIVTTSVRNEGTVDAVLMAPTISGDTTRFETVRLPFPEGAQDGQVYRDGDLATGGPSWRVTFLESNGNDSENKTYELNFTLNFVNDTP